MDKHQEEITYVSDYVMELIRKLRDGTHNESPDDCLGKNGNKVTLLFKLVTLFIKLKTFEQHADIDANLEELQAEDVELMKRFTEKEME